MYCSKCGNLCDEDAKFCIKCGASLEDAESTGPKKCSICGNINDADKEFCSVCGSKLVLHRESHESNSSFQSYKSDINPDSSIGKTPMILGIIAISTGIVCCCFPAGIVLGIISLIGAIVALKKKPLNKGKAVTALILSIIAIVYGIIFAISYINALNDPEFQEYIRQILEEYQNMEYYFRCLIK